MSLTLRTGRNLLDVAEEMNRLVRNVFDSETRETSLYKGEWSPAVDISEDDDNYYLNVELPGINREDVSVRYEEGLLSITGEKKSLKKEEKRNYHRVERLYGKFERSFRVPSRIDSEKIGAKFENGMLMITVPKLEEAKPKQIDVKIS
jgi:HSP20 family protein